MVLNLKSPSSHLQYQHLCVDQPTAAHESRIRDALVEQRGPLPPRQRKYNYLVATYMFWIHVGAMFALLPRFWSWQAVVVLAVLYWITMLGVTLGLHRLLSHRSFVAPKWLERLLVLMGTLACQFGPIEWVGLHRYHHKFSDQPNDLSDSGRGLWWAHLGWMLHDIPALQHVTGLTADLQKDPLYRWLDRWFNLVNLPIFLGLYWYGQLAGVHGGGLGLVLWGIPLRIVLVYHGMWLVNSASHAFGYRNFDSPDLSRNFWLGGLLAFGEGWHNNHHSFPYSARHGLRWFEFDITWQHIKMLRALGLAKNVRVARYTPGCEQNQNV